MEQTRHAEVLDHFDHLSIPQSVLRLIPYHVAVEYFVLPFGVDDSGRVEVLMAFPNDAEVLQAVQMHVGSLVKPTEMPKERLVKLIANHYSAAKQKQEESAVSSGSVPGRHRLSLNPSDTTVAVVNDIVHEAIRLRASDIHMEPFEREMRVRFRIDGVLQEILAIPKPRVLEVTSRL